MTAKIESMFSAAANPVTWNGSANHVRCYAHKLKLVVGHGLKSLGQKVSTAKPTIPHGVPIPVPTFEVNDGNDAVVLDDSVSDYKDKANLPDKPEGVDDEDTNEEQGGQSEIGQEKEKEDMVALALSKVST